jgi:hypothetical protein
MPPGSSHTTESTLYARTLSPCGAIAWLLALTISALAQASRKPKSSSSARLRLIALLSQKRYYQEPIIEEIKN